MSINTVTVSGNSNHKKARYDNSLDLSPIDVQLKHNEKYLMRRCIIVQVREHVAPIQSKERR